MANPFISRTNTSSTSEAAAVAQKLFAGLAGVGEDDHGHRREGPVSCSKKSGRR